VYGLAEKGVPIDLDGGIEALVIRFGRFRRCAGDTTKM
jgi:hypothetical protein